MSTSLRRVAMQVACAATPFLLAACFAPSIGDGAFACGEAGACPPGFQCGADHRCHDRADGRPARDGSTPDAGPCPRCMVRCGGACVDEKRDPTNCGTCGLRCSATEYCVGGACQCRPGFMTCSTACDTETSADKYHCGSCGARCGFECQGGTCRMCAAPYTVCGSDCVDLTSDPAHCGGCAVACTGNQICVSSACVGYTSAGDSCSYCTALGATCCNSAVYGLICVSGPTCPG